MNQRGISRVEVLVTILIIAVIGVVAVVAVSSSRSRLRDAVRLSDVRQTQAALELYFNDASAYPVATTALPLGAPSSICFGSAGFVGNCGSEDTVYLDLVPSTPTAGLGGLSACGDMSDAYCYVSNGETYKLQFELENANTNAGLSSGLNCASDSGLAPGACGAN